MNKIIMLILKLYLKFFLIFGRRSLFLSGWILNKSVGCLLNWIIFELLFYEVGYKYIVYV